ncbi:MAG TPA: SagB/ThcOx family dehydrogenase, partial [Methylibium sp.]|nr:SagB/ThcOx family dehydrogenase [Methylibium sp.]
MPKALWVALPLLALAAWALLRVWQRRAPARRTVNAVASLLLASYVLTTAGLGIFWVANQQLPVFDWHYLFGYATVLLVLLHLGFNLPTAWRLLAARPAAPAPGAAPRRWLLGGVAALAALGGAYWLGLRHGRSELRVPVAASATPGEASAAGLALVERFHAHTSHTRGGLLLRAPGAGWQDAPPRFKRDPAGMRIALPPPRERSAGGRLDLIALGAALWHTAGVTESRGPVPLRAAPSSGALFSTELYVAARAVAGLAPGLWHYDARDHALERLSDAPPEPALLGAAAPAGAPAAVLATAVFARTGHKYRDRAYRYVLADLGHALENLRVTIGALGLQPRFAARFDEAAAAVALGLDERIEGVLAWIEVQDADVGVAATTTGATPAPRAPSAARLADDTPRELTAAMHHATSLRAATAPAAL